MPKTTNTAPKKGEKKQAVNVRDIHPKTLKALNLMGQARQDVVVEWLKSIDKRLKCVETFQATATWEAMHGDDAKPTDPPPAEVEEWEPYPGDWVFVNETHTDERQRNKLVKVTEYHKSTPGYAKKSISYRGGGATFEMYRKPSEAEIAEHKRREDARLKAEAEAKELAMPYWCNRRARPNKTT